MYKDHDPMKFGETKRLKYVQNSKREYCIYVKELLNEWLETLSRYITNEKNQKIKSRLTNKQKDISSRLNAKDQNRNMNYDTAFFELYLFMLFYNSGLVIDAELDMHNRRNIDYLITINATEKCYIEATTVIQPRALAAQMVKDKLNDNIKSDSWALDFKCKGDRCLESNVNDETIREIRAWLNNVKKSGELYSKSFQEWSFILEARAVSNPLKRIIASDLTTYPSVSLEDLSKALENKRAKEYAADLSKSYIIAINIISQGSFLGDYEDIANMLYDKNNKVFKDVGVSGVVIFFDLRHTNLIPQDDKSLPMIVLNKNAKYPISLTKTHGLTALHFSSSAFLIDPSKLSNILGMDEEKCKEITWGEWGEVQEKMRDMLSAAFSLEGV